MDDLISRAAALDRIESHIRTGDELYPLTDADKILNHAFEIAASCVYNLPSAQPEMKKRTANSAQNVPNDDLISRKAAIDALREIEFSHYMEFGEYIGEDTRDVRLIRAEKAQSTIEQLPSAQPERKQGKWTSEEACEFCGFQPWYENDIHTLSYCPNCGADMRGDK